MLFTLSDEDFAADIGMLPRTPEIEVETLNVSQWEIPKRLNLLRQV